MLPVDGFRLRHERVRAIWQIFFGRHFIAADAAGRYSFDFRVGGVKLTKAYVEGMREPVEELPAWVDAVIEAVEEELGV